MPKPSVSKKRHHVSMACVACRESKVKCDGGDPKCSSCSNKHRECRYQVVDKRKLPLRVAIELLSSRVDQLCLFIRQNGLEAPPIPQEKDAALTKVLDVLGLTEVHSTSANHLPDRKSPDFPHGAETLSSSVPETLPLFADPASAHGSNGAWDQTSPDSTSQTSQAKFAQVPDPHAVSALQTFSETVTLDFSNTEQYPHTDDHSENSLANWHWTMDFGTCLTPPSPGIQDLDAESLQLPLEPLGVVSGPFEPPAVTQIPLTLDKDNRSPEEIEDLIDELSNRVGTLRFGPGGHAHFYGPTSTFNLADAPVSARQTHRTFDYNDVNPDTEVPLALEQHLLNLYFTWQDPSFHVVDREMFEKGKSAWWGKENTPFYSEALCYAMCSLGAAFETRYHPSFVTFPKSLGEFLGDRAKALLELELDSPCVATVQALVILSSHEIGVGSAPKIF